jgi:hypothetical protein
MLAHDHNWPPARGQKAVISLAAPRVRCHPRALTPCRATTALTCCEAGSRASSTGRLGHTSLS